MAKENTCKNCKYFLEFFYKGNDRLHKADIGYCLNKNTSYASRNSHVNKNEACKLWEPMILQKINRRKGIEQTLADMQANLADIALILKDDLN